jgi:hypothetical protein
MTKKMEKNKKIGMLTRNDKMTKINKGVEKVHSKHHGVELNMKFLFF